jgi:hypothetical protein
MAKIRNILVQGFSLHEDGWTETLAGLKMLITLIKAMEENGDSFNATLLLRHVYISSSYLAEQIFSKTVKEFIDSRNNNLNEEERQKYSLRKVGISYAMKNWPEQLTERKFNLGGGCLQSLKEITNKRNDIVHKLNDHSQYPNPSNTAEEIVYTSIEACKVIEKHFFPERKFSYNDWLVTYPIKQTELYKKI